MRDDVIAQILDAALALAADDGWHAMTIAHIADQTGLSHATICQYAPTPTAIPVLLARHADSAVLAEGAAAEPSIRDNLFDLLMRRFDALTPYRAGILALYRPDLSSGMAVLAGGNQLGVSMGLMLDAAGDKSQGATRMIRQAALAGLWLRVARVWMRDNSADLSRTMAALDRDLNTAEMLVNSVAEGPMALVWALLSWRRRGDNGPA